MIKSSILAHLADTGHQVNLNKAFEVIHPILSNVPLGLGVRLFHIAKAITNPALAFKSSLYKHTPVPWPSVWFLA